MQAKQSPKIVHLKKDKRQEYKDDDVGAIEVSNDGVFAAVYITKTCGSHH